MLEALDYKNVEKVSPFLRTVIDRRWGFTETAVKSVAFTQHADITRIVYRRFDALGWTLADV